MKVAMRPWGVEAAEMWNSCHGSMKASQACPGEKLDMPQIEELDGWDCPSLLVMLSKAANAGQRVITFYLHCTFFQSCFGPVSR